MKTPPNPNRSAGAKRGWETRRKNQAAQEVERASSPPPFFHQTTVGRQGLTSSSNNVSVSRLMNEYRSWQMIAAAAIADRLMKLEPIVVTETRISEETVKFEELDEHPLKQLLDNPNPTFSMMQILRLVSLWLTQVGDAYLLKVTDGLGVTRELHPLVPSNMMKITGPTGVTGYVWNGEGGSNIEYNLEEIIRIFKPDPTAPFEGVGNLGPNALSYDTDLFMTQTIQKHYRDDATPKVILKSSSDQAQIPKGDTKERWEKEWLNKYARRLGTSTGLPAWLPLGFDIEQLEGMKTKDLVLLLEYNRDKILSSNGVPAALVGIDSNINRATARASIDIFDQGTIEPQATLIANALTNQLAKDFDTSLKVRFNDVVRKDMEFELRQEAQDLQQSVKSVNQVREDRGLDPVEWGDKPLNLDKPTTPQQLPQLDDGPKEPLEEGE